MFSHVFDWCVFGAGLTLVSRSLVRDRCLWPVLVGEGRRIIVPYPSGWSEEHDVPHHSGFSLPSAI